MVFFLRLKFFWGLLRYGVRIVRLFLDRRVSGGLKVVALLAALAALSPMDVLGDIPVLGAFDDLALLWLIAVLFVHLCPRDVVSEHFAPNPPAGPSINFGPLEPKNVTPGLKLGA